MSFSSRGELTPSLQCHNGIWCLCLGFERTPQRAECDQGLWSEAPGHYSFCPLIPLGGIQSWRSYTWKYSGEEQKKGLEGKKRENCSDCRVGWEGGKWEGQWGWAPVNHCPRGDVRGTVLGAPLPVPVLWVQLFCSPCFAPPGMEGEGSMWEQANIWWEYQGCLCTLGLLLTCSVVIFLLQARSCRAGRDLKLSNLTSCPKAGSDLSKLSQQMFVQSSC